MKGTRDIVYILRDDIDPQELKYSLRSVEKNFPFNRVWFIGGRPEGITPDVELYHKQNGVNKWDMIRSSMWQAVHDERLTEDFYLFNDDFFVMKKVEERDFENFAEKTLSWRIDDLRAQYPRLNAYARTLVRAREELKILKKPEINFEVHLPMLLNKEKVKASIYRCSSPQMRSIYGNLNEIDYVQRKDVKVYDLESVPKDVDYISTTDDAFAIGAVGEYIRKIFNKQSRFED